MQGPPLPPGWAVFSSPTGHPYFHNASTGVTQWHHPAYPAPASAPPPPGAYPPPPRAPHAHAPSAPPSYPSGAAPPAGYPGASSKPSKPGAAAAAGAAASSAAGAAGAPVGSSKYTYNRQMQYKLKEKAFSLSGDGFTVKDVASGSAAFKIKGSVLSMGDKKKISDAQGNAIYTMVESLLTLRGRMQIVDSNTKQTVVTLRKKGFIPMMGTGTVLIWRGGSDEGEPWLQCKGDYFRKNFDIKEKASGRVVASVTRKSLNLSNLLLEKDTYVVRVEPGVDAALMIFLAVALDEQYRDDGNRTGVGSRLGLDF